MARQSTCHTCVYAHWDVGLWMRTLWSGLPAWPTCGNQPEAPGWLKECPRGRVCRNYRAKPPVPTGENVKMIPLTNGCYAYVDAADYEWLNQWHWQAYYPGYAVRHEKGKLVYMHRQIMKPPKGKVVDHISGNGYDNTRANMRNTTPRQNTHNRGRQTGASSIYKGVSYDRRCHRWRARIRWAGERFSLGSFDTEVEAARAYDRKAAELCGEFARLNFPEEWPAERVAEVYAQGQKERRKIRRRHAAKSKKGRKDTARKKPRTGTRRTVKAGT